MTKAVFHRDHYANNIMFGQTQTQTQTQSQQDYFNSFTFNQLINSVPFERYLSRVVSSRTIAAEFKEKNNDYYFIYEEDQKYVKMCLLSKLKNCEITIGKPFFNGKMVPITIGEYPETIVSKHEIELMLSELHIVLKPEILEELEKINSIMVHIEL